MARSLLFVLPKHPSERARRCRLAPIVVPLATMLSLAACGLAVPSVAPNVAPSVAPNVTPGVAPNVTPGVAPNVAPSVAPSAAVPPSVAPRPDPTTSNPPPQPNPPARARYQVTINGFTVRSATWDHALEVDGKGDEVYLSVPSKVLDAQGKAIAEGTGTSKVMGDTNGQNGRIACGSRSKAGGIRDGDGCLFEKPWEIDQGIGVQRDRPPMNVATVELVQGQNSLVLSPTIWEWDGGADVYEDWVTFFKGTVEKIPPPAAGGTAGIVLTAAKLGLDVALSLSDPLGQAGDRPIGVKNKGPDGYAFDPYMITLDYDAAEWLIANDPNGKGIGVLELQYKDADKYHGNYSLYLQVRKV